MISLPLLFIRPVVHLEPNRTALPFAPLYTLYQLRHTFSPAFSWILLLAFFLSPCLHFHARIGSCALVISHHCLRPLVACAARLPGCPPATPPFPCWASASWPTSNTHIKRAASLDFCLPLTEALAPSNLTSNLLDPPGFRFLLLFSAAFVPHKFGLKCISCCLPHGSPHFSCPLELLLLACSFHVTLSLLCVSYFVFCLFSI